MLARATQAVVGLGDVLMVAPLGEEPLAAAATGALNTYFLAIVPIGVAFIIQSFAAQLTGQGDAAGVSRYAWYGLIMAGLVGIVALAAIPALGPVLALGPFTPGVRDLMWEYLAIRMTSMTAMVGVEVLGNWFAGRGNTRRHMVAGVVTMVIDLGLNWLLIEGHWGFPALGVAGAAWSSALSTWLGFAYLVAAFLRVPGPRSRLRPAEFGRMLRFGLPNGISWFLEFAAFALFINVAMGHLGTVALAAMNIQLELSSVAFMPAIGLASSGAILVGQALGLGRLDEVGSTVRRTALAAGLWEALVGAVFLVAAEPILERFASSATDQAGLIVVGAVLLRVGAVAQAFDALGMTLAEALRAAGDTTWCMWARMILAWAFFAPAAYLTVFVFDGGPVAAMWCVVAYLGLLSGTFLWRYRQGAWRRIDLTGTGPRAETRPAA